MWTDGRGQDSSSERMSGWFEFWGSREVERTREGIEYSRIQQYGLDRGEVDRVLTLLPTTGTSSTIQLIKERVELGRIETDGLDSRGVEKSSKGVE